MQWHHLDEIKPKESGRYLVVAQYVTEITGILKINPFISDYSTKTKMFNFDQTMQERNERPRIYAWCEIPRHPKPKGDTANA